MKKGKTDWTFVDSILGKGKTVDIDKLVKDSLEHIDKQTKQACAKLQERIDTIKKRSV